MTSDKTPFVALTNPWVESQICDSSLPLWQRLAMQAWVTAQPNGHAQLTSAQCADFFNVSKPRITEARKKAIEHGWLDPISRSDCLILPDGGIGVKAIKTNRETAYICRVHSVKSVTNSTAGGQAEKRKKRNDGTKIAEHDYGQTVTADATISNNAATFEEPLSNYFDASADAAKDNAWLAGEEILICVQPGCAEPRVESGLGFFCSNHCSV